MFLSMNFQPTFSLCISFINFFCLNHFAFHFFYFFFFRNSFFLSSIQKNWIIFFLLSFVHFLSILKKFFLPNQFFFCVFISLYNLFHSYILSFFLIIFLCFCICICLFSFFLSDWEMIPESFQNFNIDRNVVKKKKKNELYFLFHLKRKDLNYNRIRPCYFASFRRGQCRLIQVIIIKVILYFLYIIKDFPPLFSWKIFPIYSKLVVF